MENLCGSSSFASAGGSDGGYIYEQPRLSFLSIRHVDRSDLVPDGMRSMVEHERGEYSVCQFFPDESYEYVRRWVSAEEAVKAAHHYTHSIGAQLGTTTRVIITDGGDCVNFEWKFGEGIVFGGPEQ